jgi:carbon-monoxide dehydrogenase small subunit
MTVGPAGSSHAKTGFASDSERTEAIAARTPPRRVAGETTDAPIMSIDDFKPHVTFTHDFVVRHRREDVWAFFARTNDVAACLPGAAITGGDNRNVTGKMCIKVGPIAAEFEGVAVVERDASNYSGIIRGSGRDQRSSSATRGSIVYRLVPGDDGRSTCVNIVVGYTMTGALAQFSRSALIQDIANRITQAFVRNLEARLAMPESAAPSPTVELNAGRLLLSVVGARLKAWWRKLVRR